MIPFEKMTPEQEELVDQAILTFLEKKGPLFYEETKSGFATWTTWTTWINPHFTDESFGCLAWEER